MKFFLTYLLSTSIFWTQNSVWTARKARVRKNLTLEDEYVEFYGNSPFESEGWVMIRTWYVRDRRDEDVKKFCEKAHKLAGYGKAKVVMVLLRMRFLSFENPEYMTRAIDTLAYGIEGELDQTKDENYYYVNDGNFWYLTDGRRPGCAYYLTYWNRTSKEFRLSKYVCGLPKDNEAISHIRL